MSDFWDGNPEPVNNGERLQPGRASVLINGSSIPVEPGTPVIETVKRMALDAGFGKFRVFLNGADVKPSSFNTGDVINEGDRFELRPYDVAGI